jgi:hypothetical protein
VSTLGANRSRNAKKTLLALAARAASRSRIYSLWRPFPKASRFLNGARYQPEGIVSKRRAAGYASGTSGHWVKVKCEGWREANQHRHKLFEGPPKIEPGPRERELTNKHAELARVRERLLAPDVSPGLARQLRKHVTALEREIAELEENG